MRQAAPPADDTPPADDHAAAAGRRRAVRRRAINRRSTAGEPPPRPPHPVIVDDGVLSQAELDYFVDAAIARWSDGRADRRAGRRAGGDDASRVADMSGLNLGSFSPTQITLDADAAGRGWYLDGTPLDDAEFGNVLLRHAGCRPTRPGRRPGTTTCSPPSCTRWATRSASGTRYASGDRGELMYGWLLHRRAAAAGRGRRRRRGRGLDHRARSSSGAPIDIGVLPAGKTGHHPVAGDDRPADQRADRQSGRTRARSRPPTRSASPTATTTRPTPSPPRSTR